MMCDPILIDEVAEITGHRFTAALAERDFASLQAVFNPDVRARLLITPGLITPMNVTGLMVKFRQWFEEAVFFEVQRVDIRCLGSKLGISYRVLLQDPDGWSVLEQHAYGSLKNSRIEQFDLLCSGFEPVTPLEGGRDVSRFHRL